MIAAPDGEVVKLGDSFKTEEQIAAEVASKDAERAAEEAIDSISQVNRIEVPTGE